MPTAAFTTLGCKVNQYETQRILDDFESRGFTITEFNKPADVYVVNSCSVTQAAERKSRYMVRKLARQNPDAIVVMTGCYGEMARIKGEEIEGASLIVENHLKLSTLSHVLAAYPDLERKVTEAGRSGEPKRSLHRTRATLKVQDGCNVFCSFCSIPYTRRYMLSRPIEDLVAEVEARLSEGYREIVVTGVLVGAYGQDGFRPVAGADLPRASSLELIQRQTLEYADLAAVLLRIARVPGLTRVRLSSIEPTQVTDRLLQAFADEPKLCRHLHIPLQSGDTGILAAMNRPYDKQFYIDRCRAARAVMPDIAITSDIMVGFPGEDEAAFENTIDVVRTVGFARAHLFRYSSRPGTPAAHLEGQIPDSLKEDRSLRLNRACREAQAEFIAKNIGRELEVLVEGRERIEREAREAREHNEDAETVRSRESVDAQTAEPQVAPLLSGYTSNYIRVEFSGGSHLVGQLVKVRLIEPAVDGALGEVGDAHFGALEAPPDAMFIPLTTFTGAV